MTGGETRHVQHQTPHEHPFAIPAAGSAEGEMTTTLSIQTR
jgi:hypothetical protein